MNTWPLEGLAWTSLFSLLALPLIAGLLVLSTHVPLGAWVLRRGIVFIDLAVAQVAALGVLAARSWGLPEGGPATWLAAWLAACAGAALLAAAERRMGQHQEALIGVVFVLAASAGSLVLAGRPQGNEHLNEVLAGQLLWVSWQPLCLLALASAAVWVWLGLQSHRRGPACLRGSAAYYLALATAVTASVQVVGVYLVFASLIIPALASAQSKGKRKSKSKINVSKTADPPATQQPAHANGGLDLPADPSAWWQAWVLGAAAYALGLSLSALWDLPSSPFIAWALALLGLASCALRRMRGG